MLFPELCNVDYVETDVSYVVGHTLVVDGGLSLK